MIITGKVDGVNIDALTGAPKVTFVISHADTNTLLQGCADFNRETLLAIEVKPYRQKRSLNANAYAWKLITEIADALRAPKDEIYLRMLKRYGKSEIISIAADVPIQQFIKYSEVAGVTTLNGKQFTHYRVFKGSSEYDTREMSILIDGIVAEAKELGIQTETPEELAKLKALWKE